jgi:subtilase-type serine protease
VFNSGGQINLGEGNVLTNDGILSPGGLGTIVDTTLVGDLVLSPSSVLQAQIDNRDHSDKLTVTGDLRLLGGAIRPLATETITGSHEYTVIAAGSIAESAIAGGSPVPGTALLDAYILVGPDQDPNTVRLVVTQMPFDDPHLARTENHGSLGGALQEIAAAGGNGVTNALQQLGTPEDVRHAYDQLSGQSRPPLAPVAVKGTSRFRGTVTDRVRGLQTGIVGGMFNSGPFAGNGPDSGIGSGPMYNAAVAGQSIAIGHGSPVLADSKWGLWGWGYGLFGNRRTEENATGYTYNTYGASVGLDYQFSERFLAGLVLGAADGKVDFANSRDNADFRALSVGLYDSLTSNRWYLDSIASYANLSYDTERFVDLTSERLQGDLNGYELAAYVEGGYNWNLSRHLLLQPLASLQYTYLHLDSYTETGGASALSYDDQTYESVMGSLGARLTQQLFESASGLRTDVQVRGRWVHEFGDNQSSVSTFFVNNPGAVFTIHDAAIARDSAWLGAGLSTEITRRLRAYVDYDALLNSDETVHVIGAALQYRW